MTGSFSYWEQQHFFQYDVIIVGSGIVGLNAAIHIKSKSPSTRVAVLERGFLPSGASTKNAGFACFGSISELMEQEKSCGTEGLYALIEKRWKGLLALREILGDTAIDYKRYGGYELFKPEENNLSDQCQSRIEHYNLLLKDIANQDNAFRTNHSKIKTFGFKTVDTLIENVLEAQIDPGKMMTSLMQKAAALGVLIFNHCQVDTIEQKGAGHQLFTQHGIFRTSKVLVCTNAFVRQLLPDLEVRPGRGQVLVSEPIHQLKFKGTFHYQKGYYYFRNIGNRVLLGGGRNLDFKTEETTVFGETELIQESLLELLHTVILPDRRVRVDYKWSGIMAFGPELIPIVKEVRPGVFCAVRCNGMGIAIGTQTGREAGELLMQNWK